MNGLIRSVANLTRVDALEFMDMANQVDLKVAAQSYPLINANQALSDFKAGKANGAAVLIVA